MKLNLRHPNHPDDVMLYTTEDLRKHFLIETVFVPDETNLTYSLLDRAIIGGIMPKTEPLLLKGGKGLGSELFFERREGGIINIGGKGKVNIDGVKFEMDTKDALYIGRGINEISFSGYDKNEPPKFFLASAPAHHYYPTTLLTEETAKQLHLGSRDASNKRVVTQYVHPDVVKSCQLVMGMTELDLGCVWNTMPAHTHCRRMESYFYFRMEEETRVFHIMGEAKETRHIVVSNEQAVLSPSWSLHSGCGTGKYSYIWVTCGENTDFTDMDSVGMGELK